MKAKDLIMWNGYVMTVEFSCSEGATCKATGIIHVWGDSALYLKIEKALMTETFLDDDGHTVESKVFWSECERLISSVDDIRLVSFDEGNEYNDFIIIDVKDSFKAFVDGSISFAKKEYADAYLCLKLFGDINAVIHIDADGKRSIYIARDTCCDASKWKMYPGTYCISMISDKNYDATRLLDSIDFSILTK